ncbi:MAG: ChaN family lipoprotein [Phycisphaeraceae bacterium]|nr:ChaN family lipoprotein [Phycisphaeraceae bacterium]MCW5761787.1 ChaN family lipoprotein [Phycisphaeraceae bacterium]
MKAMMLCVMLAGLLGGCAGAKRTEADVVVAPLVPRESVRIFDRGGAPVDWDAMIAGVRDAGAIIIGETHGHAMGLAAAADVWEAVASSSAALLLEFFERDQQVALDDYLSGVTDTDAFLKAAGRTSSNYPAGHSRMVETARAVGAPVIAANAPRRYVRRTTAGGYENLVSLGSEQQRLFVVPDVLVTGKYRDDFFGLMGGMSHGPAGEGGGMPAAMIEKMYRSQQMWDATMADSTARALMAGAQPALLVIGRFHSDFDGGTVEFLRHRVPDARIVTLSMVASSEVEIADDDRGRADFVFYVGQ